jgi:hypothetical protein
MLLFFRFTMANARPNMNNVNSNNVRIDALREKVPGAAGYISVRKASTP